MGCLCNVVILGSPPAVLTRLMLETYDAGPSGGLVNAADPNFSADIDIAPAYVSGDSVSGSYAFKSYSNACSNAGNSVAYSLPANTIKCRWQSDIKIMNMPVANRPSGHVLGRIRSNLGFSGPILKFGTNNTRQIYFEEGTSGYGNNIGATNIIPDATWFNLRIDLTLNDPGVANGLLTVILNGVTVYTGITENVIAVSQSKIINIIDTNNYHTLTNCPPQPAPNPYVLYDNTEFWRL